MRWIEIAIDAMESSADAVSNILIEEGCAGTATGGPVSLSPRQAARVLAYLPMDDTMEERVQRIRTRMKELPKFGLSLFSDDITIKFVQEEDWANAWKQFFKPIRIEKIVVKPSWEEHSNQPGDIIIELDPGMAFGTGSHASTQLCLKALQRYIKGGETVLDVGTGSGILAIAAAKLGASKVVGIDVDSVAVEVAEANVAHVQLQDQITIVRADGPEAFSGTADVVVANIIASVIIEMAEQLRSKMKAGGKLIVSGIIRERADDVKTRLTDIGLDILDDERDGEWVALTAELPNR